ncbi:hypothetical protein D0Z00_000964 [Geotrichum galactomycetum]|uniref:Uncharacterized protein n=1 Tax=Geotrichum galactomycetum TaxID=27317 RepID=A0ACB6V8G1_9ASCO|nr:hypothetical protein D0Z00_000964 [Geotrichum candidum]
MDLDKLITKLIYDYPSVDSSLIHAIAHEAISEAAIRETLDVLGADAQFETPDWKSHETRDLENALADTEEDFSLIEFRDGKLSFKHEDCTNDENELEEDDFDEHIKENNLDLSTKTDLAKLYRLYPTMSKDKVKTVFIDNRYIIDNAAEELLSLDAAERFQREEDQLEKHMERLQLAKDKKNHWYYSEQSHKFNAQKHVALDSQFAHMAEKQTQSHCIDLHGLPLHFAVTVATEKLYQWWQIETHHVQQTSKAGVSISALKRATKPLKIITGAGRHSAANIPKIKNAVRKKLVEERWRFQEFDSYFLVNGVL